ncbi:MAG: hypothetical protein K2U26_07295 [Cyclobacteriaceae bacterium]|nr:hypothetical protein [Cyclobacteriaceae bacterium]
METLDIKINLDFKQLTSIVKQLNPSEKMKLNEVIWDEQMEIPEEHQKLVLQRINRARQSPGRMLPWDKAVKLLKSS